MRTALPMRTVLLVLLAWPCFGLSGCDDDDDGAGVQQCDPPGACSCGPGVERPLSCTCNGGSSCEIQGSDIEFQCQGNAACGMTCGTNCLITCPGTTECTVDVDDLAIVSCPGTATCSVRCRGDCSVEMTGAARATIFCDAAAEGASCTFSGCQATDCGNGVFACRMDCPAEP